MVSAPDMDAFNRRTVEAAEGRKPGIEDVGSLLLLSAEASNSFEIPGSVVGHGVIEQWHFDLELTTFGRVMALLDVWGMRA